MYWHTYVYSHNTHKYAKSLQPIRWLTWLVQFRLGHWLYYCFNYRSFSSFKTLWKVCVMVRFSRIGKAFFIGQRRRNLYPLNHVLNLISSFFVTSISLISKHRLDLMTSMDVCARALVMSNAFWRALFYLMLQFTFFFFLDPLFKYKRLMFGCIANLKLLYIIIESNVFNPHFILWVVLGFYVYIISLAKPCLRS